MDIDAEKLWDKIDRLNESVITLVTRFEALNCLEHQNKISKTADELVELKKIYEIDVTLREKEIKKETDKENKIWDQTKFFLAPLISAILALVIAKVSKFI